jgi:hypothetical protein
MHEEQLTPMTSGQTLLTDADSIREIRDGLISFDDLAIRVDKVDARAFAISEATRLAAMKKKQFIERHHDDPAARHPYNSSPADAVADTVNNEPLLGLRTLIPDNHHYIRGMAEPFLSRLKWKETFVGLAAMLAITTSSIPALPSIFNKAPGEDTLSQLLHQPRDIQDAIASVPSDLQVESVVAGVRELPVALVEELSSDINVSSSSDQNQQPVVVPSDMIVSVAAIQWQHEVANDEAVSSNLSQDSQAIADRLVPTTGEGNADDNYPLAVDHIKGDVATEEEQHPVTAETVQTASVADAFELTDASRDEKIQELLSLGRQSIDKYRLLTPEDDNAYGYFRAVLRQDPDNEDAHAGIKEIVALYIILARKSVDRHNDDRARRYINRGLSIQPENRELLALQDSINRAIQSASADTGIIAGGEGAPLESESPREGPKQGSLIQGIGSFFEKLKAEARSGEVHTPAGWNDTLP